MNRKNPKTPKKVLLSELTPLERAEEYRRRGRQLIKKAKELEEYYSLRQDDEEVVRIR